MWKFKIYFVFVLPGKQFKFQIVDIILVVNYYFMNIFSEINYMCK